MQQLLALGVPREAILRLSDGSYLSDEKLAQMEHWSNDNLQAWLSCLEEKCGVFFSWPLDLDLAMLEAFPAAYEATIDGTGPRMSIEDAAKIVLGTAGPGLTSYVYRAENFKQHMPAYRYHFLTHSKPATHLRALSHVELPNLRARIPAPLERLLHHVAAQLSGI